MFRNLLSYVTIIIPSIAYTVEYAECLIDLEEVCYDVQISITAQTINLFDSLAKALFMAPVKGTGLAQ